MIGLHDIPLGGGDDPACRRCGGAAPPATTELAELKERIDRAYGEEDAGTGVLFTGTGPGEHPALMPLVEHAISSGVSRIGVRTSGQGIADPSAVARLIKGGVRVFETVLLGSHAGGHDALAGVPGSFDAAVSLVAAVRDAADTLGVRVAVRARVRVCRHNLQDLPSTVMCAAEMGVSSVVLDCPPTLDPRRSAEWVGAACDTGTVNRVWVAVTGMPAEALGDKGLHAQDVVTVTGAER